MGKWEIIENERFAKFKHAAQQTVYLKSPIDKSVSTIFWTTHKSVSTIFRTTQIKMGTLFMLYHSKWEIGK